MTRRSIDLSSATPPEWVAAPLADFDAFLCDHANCERKASALAVSLAIKHPDRTRIIPALMDIAQEELRHYAEVYAVMAGRGLTLTRDAPDPYVNALLALMRHGREPRFLDRLLVASLIECRGAERFGLVAEALADPDLAAFYRELCKAETKHGHQFAALALEYFDADTVYGRLAELAEGEAEIVAALPWRPALH